jgi:hypothetical protein
MLPNFIARSVGLLVIVAAALYGHEFVTPLLNGFNNKHRVFIRPYIWENKTVLFNRGTIYGHVLGNIGSGGYTSIAHIEYN